MPLGIIFIRSSTTGIKETFGKFARLVQPGLSFYIPFVQKITPISNRLKQDTFKFEVKTKDNVFTHVHIAVQYKIKDSDTQKAFYSLSNPIEQIDAYIENAVRAKVPRMELDHLFETHDEICKDVSEKLSSKMKDHGYTIENTLITAILPSTEVRDAMNKINASKRLKEAATNEADAMYIRQIKEAEGDKDRKRLQGEGISLQRLAIIRGYKEGIEGLTSQLGLSPKDIIDFVMRTQHLDTLMSISKSNNAKTIFMDHSPSSDFRKQLMMANEANEKHLSDLSKSVQDQSKLVSLHRSKEFEMDKVD